MARRSLSLIALTTLLFGCAQTHAPEGATTGIYELVVEVEVDECSPTRAAGTMGPVAVLVQGVEIDLPVPESGLSSNFGPRVRLRPDAFHRETNVAVPGCAGAFAHHEWTLLGSGDTHLELLHHQSWHGLEGCVDAQTVMPSAPANDCRSERRLRYDLAEACPSPCALELVASGGLSCSCG